MQHLRLSLNSPDLINKNKGGLKHVDSTCIQHSHLHVYTKYAASSCISVLISVDNKDTETGVLFHTPIVCVAVEYVSICKLFHILCMDIIWVQLQELFLQQSEYLFLLYKQQCVTLVQYQSQSREGLNELQMEEEYSF